MTSQIEESLRTIQITLANTQTSWQMWCEKLPYQPEVRYSLINNEGTILCDTTPGKKNQKIKSATELEETFKTGFTYQVRHSEDFGGTVVYADLKLSNQLAVRKTVPISSLKNDMGRFDRVLFLRIVPFAVLSYLIFLFLFYRISRPLGNILSKVESFKIDIPFKKNLELLYQKDEWARVEEALNEADNQLKGQVLQTQIENEKITAILESIHDDIIAIDNFETVLFYNTNFKNNFIRERSHQELIPKIWHSFSDDSVLNGFRNVLKTGQEVTLKGLNFPSSHNSERFFDLTITPLKIADGKIHGALGVFYDVTDFKRTEQMRVDFVANVSHEIRTPLTSVKGFTQVLTGQKNKIDPELHPFLEKIHTNTERMISLFNDLLNLSVIESKERLKLEDFNIEELIDAVADNVRTNYSQKTILIEKDLRQSEIRGDHRLIEQVITNLMDNACKYSNHELTIKVKTLKTQDKAQILISDNGHGISKEHLQRIFERFYRVDSSRETSRGAGLGLSIVKHIINKHGGRIWVESEENHGSTFIIELPLKS